MFVCSKCEARFVVYQQCVDHACDITRVVFTSVEEFSKQQQPASEAYINYLYVLYIRDQMLAFAPEETTRSASETKEANKVLKKAEKNFLKGCKQQVSYPDLGLFTLKNVCCLLRRKHFTKSHLTLMYNNVLPTFPAHFTMLWSKVDFHFWPFFFSKEHIFSQLFLSSCLKLENGTCFVFTREKKWQAVELRDVLKCVCDRVIVPLLQYLSAFVVDCVKNKKCNLNCQWKDFDQERRSIKLQLRNIGEGSWFDFFEALPHSFDYFGPNLPGVDEFICIDSILKGEIEGFSREWIPFLGLFCCPNILKEKYGE